jgi:hypothetical protein
MSSLLEAQTRELAEAVAKRSVLGIITSFVSIVPPHPTLFVSIVSLHPDPGGAQEKARRADSAFFLEADVVRLGHFSTR